MNQIQKLIKLRGISARALARSTGFNYHSLQKVIKGTRKTPRIQKAIAAYFDTHPRGLFGPGSARIVALLMELEIDRQLQVRRQELMRRWVPQNKNSKTKEEDHVPQNHKTL